MFFKINSKTLTNQKYKELFNIRKLNVEESLHLKQINDVIEEQALDGSIWTFA